MHSDVDVKEWEIEGSKVNWGVPSVSHLQRREVPALVSPSTWLLSTQVPPIQPPTHLDPQLIMAASCPLVI